MKTRRIVITDYLNFDAFKYTEVNITQRMITEEEFTSIVYEALNERNIPIQLNFFFRNLEESIYRLLEPAGVTEDMIEREKDYIYEKGDLILFVPVIDDYYLITVKEVRS